MCRVSAENCIWVSKKESFLQTSKTNVIDVDGEVHSGKEWARILNMSINAINKRIKKDGIDDTILFIHNKLNGIDISIDAISQKKKDQTIIVGKEYGIYKVIEDTNNKTKSGKKIYKIQCLICGHTFERAINTIRQCPKNCTHNSKQAKTNSKKVCSVCGKNICRENKSGLCQQCSVKSRQNEKIKMWKETGKTGLKDEATKVPNAIREYILEKQNHKCAICGQSDMHNQKALVFILDHINGDAADNQENNLRFICPNCDSQLPTYKSKNKNSARKFRHKYT